MGIPIYQLIFLGIIMFFVGYQLQQKKLSKYKQEKLKAEEMALRSDSEYLKMVHENEVLKEELRQYDQENDILIKLQEELIRKQATR